MKGKIFNSKNVDAGAIAAAEAGAARKREARRAKWARRRVGGSGGLVMTEPSYVNHARKAQQRAVAGDADWWR